MDFAIATEQAFPFDTVWVRLSTDGCATFPLQRSILFWETADFFFGDITFHRARVDLTPLSGRTSACIQLYFDTADNLFNNFGGVFIDRVEVRRYTEQ